jgi:hypothetical protein
MDIEVARPLAVTRLYSDSDGESHFSDEKMPFALVDFAPPAPPISVSEVRKADEVFLISSPPGWFGDWHPAPRKQMMLVLSGLLEVEVSDGGIRQIEPGSVLLVEDTMGRGHISRVLGEDRVYMMAVSLAEK